jgi:hypothetical protein
MPALQCQTCGEPVRLEEPIPRDAECPACHADLRACRNCRHYDPSYNNACRETMADPVEDKSRRNFCEYFYFSRAPFAKPVAGGRADDARRKLDSLFGGGSAATSGPTSAREKLDALFGGATSSASDRASDARRKLDDLFRKPPKEDDAEDDPSA